MSEALMKNYYTLLKYIKDNKSVFITGSAGTGKTSLLKTFIKKYNRKDRLIVTASTGIASLHIQGVTIHSLLKINSGSVPEIVEKIRKDVPCLTRWIRSDILIIDEISFIDQNAFEKMSHVLSMVRNNTDPFGGIKLILCGDFAQLPPVKFNNQVGTQFCFYSDLFEQLNLKTIYLKKSMRQASDFGFFNLLEKVRYGQIDDLANEMLEKRLVSHHKDFDIYKSVHIYGKNESVIKHNNMMIERLSSDKKIFEMSIATNDQTKVKSLTQGDLLKLVKTLPCQMTTKLCVDARVYLCINLNIKKGLVNGLFGTIKSFKNIGDKLYPVVKFENIEKEVIIKKHAWQRYYKGINLSFSQIPLLLGWSFTVHKSQGMTIEDNVVLNLDHDNIFETQQAYVALSRAISIDRVYLNTYDPTVFKLDPNVSHFYGQLTIQ